MRPLAGSLVLRSIVWVAVGLASTGVRAQAAAAALDRALAGTQASAVVLDWDTGRVIAQHGAAEQGSPGSAIKPLLLDYALKRHIVAAATTVYCRRNLRIAGRALACTHPADRTTFDAAQALAESCNTWFAEMGKRFTPQQLDDALESAGLRHASMRERDVEQRELAVLGLTGIAVTPEELARSYRAMLLHHPEEAVLRGMKGSVDYGMAGNARVEGVAVLGKTGTAARPGTARTEGWFAGAVAGRFVLVVCVPVGNGAGAALLAGRYIAAMEGHAR